MSQGGRGMSISLPQLLKHQIGKAVVHIYNGLLLSHKKRRNTAVCDNMGGSEKIQTDL